MSNINSPIIYFRERMRAAAKVCADELKNNIEIFCKDLARKLYMEGVEGASLLEMSLGGENKLDISIREMSNLELEGFGIEAYAIFQINTRRILEIRAVINQILKALENEGFLIDEHSETAGTLRIKFKF